MGVVEDVADDDADVGCQVVDQESQGDLPKGGTVDFRPGRRKTEMKKRRKNEPFKVDNDCCSKKGGGEGESNWVKYQGELLEIERQNQGEPLKYRDKYQCEILG